MSVNRKTVAYWATTGLLSAGLVYGSVADITLQPASIEIMEQLGYPLYLLVILGVWKALAAVAILAPGMPRLKEWAYAGVFFNMTGAFVSHVVIGSAPYHFIASGLFVLLVIASWALRPQSRVLGSLFPERGQRRSLATAATPVPAR